MIHREAKGIKAMNQKNEFRWADVEPWCVLRMVLRNCWMLILAALIAGMGAKAGPGLALDPGYTSTITYAVLSKSASATSRANYNAANEVAVKYSSMLESHLMKERICQALGVDTLPGTITAQVEGETNLLRYPPQLRLPGWPLRWCGLWMPTIRSWANTLTRMRCSM